MKILVGFLKKIILITFLGKVLKVFGYFLVEKIGESALEIVIRYLSDRWQRTKVNIEVLLIYKKACSKKWFCSHPIREFKILFPPFKKIYILDVSKR